MDRIFEEPYMKITAEVKYPDGESNKAEITSNKWDSDGEEMSLLLRRLLMGIGFAESTVESIFGDDCGCYSELLPDKEVPDWEGLELADDPCEGCEECCSDTACLHEEPFDEV